MLAEPHLIEQVILNLVTNAAEAMKNYEGVSDEAEKADVRQKYHHHR